MSVSVKTLCKYEPYTWTLRVHIATHRYMCERLNEAGPPQTYRIREGGILELKLHKETLLKSLPYKHFPATDCPHQNGSTYLTRVRLTFVLGE